MKPAPLVLLLALAAVITGGAGAMRSTLRTAAYAANDAGAAAVNPSAPDAPSGLTVLAQSSTSVTIGWVAPTTGPEPTGFVLEGGLREGEVLGAIPIGAGARALTVEAPAGVLYVRLHAVAGADRSAPSNEIRVVVDVAEPPSAPADLLGLVDGHTVTLSWTNTFAGGTPTQLWLQVSGPQPAVVPIPFGETFTYTGVPTGTYGLSLIAGNASGMSAPSNAVSLTFPRACSGPPDAPIDFQAWTSDAQLFVSWRPPVSGPAVTSYTVLVSGTASATVPTTAHEVSGPLPAGAYAVSVVANNTCGAGAPAPAAPEWTAAVPQGATLELHWSVVPQSRGYRVYWSSRRDALEPLDATASYMDTTSSPVVLPVADPAVPLYYRVYDLHGPVAGTGGPVALAVGFTAVNYPEWPGNLTPGLWDLDGDGCLDMLGARGGCDGTFHPYALESAGLGGLKANGRMRTNRDSRFADFTGDGITDIFTNVYTRADDPIVSALLHVGDGHGGFTEDPGVAALHIRGFGETVLAADFDNDGDLDVFIPHYSHLDDGGHNWLLVNDGAGRFTDHAQAAGVATNEYFQPEGAQALDVNQDGWIDIHVSSRLYLNNGDLTFTDHGAALGLPILFDEGMRLFDADLDGDFDLVHHDTSVTRLFTNDRGTYDAGAVIDGDLAGLTVGYGVNVCDVNGDGYEDLLVANNDRGTLTGQPHLLINAGGTFVPSPLPATAPVYNDLIACADFDGTGLPDIVSRWSESAEPSSGSGESDAPLHLVRHRHYVNRPASTAAIRLRVVGSSGARNQQGRVVRVRPIAGPAKTILRVVDSGSGLMAQNGYDLLVATPWPGDYEVSVRFATGWVRTIARPGAALTIDASGAVAPALR